MNIHCTKPQRSSVAAREAYQLYRPELKADFNDACGYCDDSDARVDPTCFHIDHFAPKKRFPNLKTAYSNLVYACRFCNTHKSSKWIGDDAATHHNGSSGFVDPCSADYELHLERSENGRIVAKTELGRYIVKALNLSLLRHELLWRARQARALRAEISVLIERYQDAGLPKADAYIGLLERSFALTKEIERYESQAIHG